MTNEIINICGVACYEKDGVAYLKLEDVARGLGFTTVAASGNEAIRWTRVNKYLSDLGVDNCPHDGFIPENIFYRLAMKAKNETAEKFQALVADKIIPSVRKHGAYITPSKLGDLLRQPESVMEMLAVLSAEQQKNAELTEQNKALAQRNEEMRPKEEYFDDLVDTNSLMNFTDTAKALKISRKKMLDVLVEQKLLYRQGKYGKLIPYEKNNHGYFEVKEQKNAFGSWAGPQTFVTVAGRQLLMQMRDEGYFD